MQPRYPMLYEPKEFAALLRARERCALNQVFLFELCALIQSIVILIVQIPVHPMMIYLVYPIKGLEILVSSRLTKRSSLLSLQEFLTDPKLNLKLALNRHFKFFLKFLVLQLTFRFNHTFLRKQMLHVTILYL